MSKDRSSIIIIILSGAVTVFSVFVLSIAIFHKKLNGENHGLILDLIAQLTILVFQLAVVVAMVLPAQSMIRRLYFIHKILLSVNCSQLAYFLALFVFEHSKSYELAILFAFLIVYSLIRIASLRSELA